jgi:chitinase
MLLQGNPYFLPEALLLSMPMHFRWHLLALIIGASFHFTSSIHADTGKEQDQFVVAGYLPHYRVTTATPESLKPLTDLIYFGLTPPAGGRLDKEPVSPAILQKLQEIKRLNGCRLLLCVGGWNRSEGFSKVTLREGARKQLVKELLAFCRENGFDGVDFDWEHPRGAQELASYQALLTDARESFNPAGLLVTVAQASWQDLGARAYRAVDRIHLMSYDHDYPQATFEKSLTDVERVIQWGCPPHKVTLGVPFYGRSKRREARSYRKLMASHLSPPSNDEINGYAFNGSSTIMQKVRHARQKKLAGIMIWETGQDDPREEFSLLKAIGRQSGRESSAGPR